MITVEDTRQRYAVLSDIKAREARCDRASYSAESLSERIRLSAGYRKRAALHPKFSTVFEDIDFKTLLTTAGAPGFVPRSARSGVVSPFPARRPVIADVIPTSMTREPSVRFMRGVSEDSGAAPTAEGVTKGESALDFDEVESYLTKIPAWIPVTVEQVNDVDGLDYLIDFLLQLQLLREEEDQIMNGVGGVGNMTGFYVDSDVQVQTLGADTLADAILEAIGKVRATGYAEPSAVLINPDDFTDERKRKDSLGNYIWGPPSLPPPYYIWEKPAILTYAVTVGQPLVGDFSYAHLSRSSIGEFKVSDQHADYAIMNRLVLLAEMRSSLELYRPEAFCYVTS